MKERNFDWLLQGCHPLSEVAQAYYPCEYNSSSIRSFRKHIKGIPQLYADLLEAEYTDKVTTPTTDCDSDPASGRSQSGEGGTRKAAV